MQNIFIHGLEQNSSSWDKTISFMPKSAHIFCPDLFAILNHKETTYSNLYRDFSDYCNDISGKLNLCGLSLGGVLALNYAIDYPTRLQSLVLIAAQYKMPRTLLKFQNILFHFMPKSTFEKQGFQKKDIMQLTNSMIELDFSKNLCDISCPTLIVCGEKDKANKKAAKNLVENIPNANFHLVENTGHEVNIEAPEKLATILHAFWQEYEQYERAILLSDLKENAASV